MNSAKPLFTVVLPTIGRPKYFGHTLASLARQKNAKFELLISDNASIPRVEEAEIGKALGLRPYRLLRRVSRLSFVDHFNQCLEDATGAWIVFVSDDDLVADNFVESLENAAILFPQVSTILVRQKVIDADDFGACPPIVGNAELFDGLSFIEAKHAAAPLDIYTVVSLAARKSDLLSIGGYKNYPRGLHADNMVWHQLALKGHVALLPIGFHYRVHPISEGLGVSSRELITASAMFEADLEKLLGGTERGSQICKGWMQSNSRLIYRRWLMYQQGTLNWKRDSRDLRMFVSRIRDSRDWTLVREILTNAAMNWARGLRNKIRSILSYKPNS